MAGISINTGITTGIDIGALVQQMVDLERTPIRALSSDKSFFNSKKQAIEQLETQLAGLQKISAELDGLTSSLTGTSTEEEFFKYSGTSSDSDVFTLSIGDDPQLGNYDIQVKQIAQANRLAHGGVADKADALSVSDAKFVLKVGTTEHSFDIKAGETTLEDLQEQINNIEGLKASIVNNGSDTDPYQLVITSEETGLDNAVSVDISTDLAGFEGTDFTENQEAKDALMVIDGISITGASNTITDAIEGVTFELKGDTENDDATFDTVNASVGLDKGAIKQKVEQFVESFNSIVSFIDSHGYNKETQKSGILGGDSMLFSIESQLRNMVNSTIYGQDGKGLHISDIGLTTNGNGELELDSAKFNEMLDSNPNDVRSIFVSDGIEDGISAKFGKFLKSFLDKDTGAIAGRKDSYEAIVKRIDGQIENKQMRIEKYELRIRNEFIAMETMASSIKNNQDLLLNQLVGLE